MTVIAFGNRHDPPPPGRVARAGERDFNRLGPTCTKDKATHSPRRLDEMLGQRRARGRREPVISNVKVIACQLQRFGQLRIAIAEIEGTAIDVQANQPPPGHVVNAAALAPADTKIDALTQPEIHFPRIPELFCPGIEVFSVGK